jgi:hypothetical protein
MAARQAVGIMVASKKLGWQYMDTRSIITYSS